MELIVIDSSRLKIMLTGEEMTEYRLDPCALDTENEKTKRILYDILDRAKKKAGFDGECERVFVQIFPSRDGGCEMFVTKYSQLYDEEVPRIMSAAGMAQREKTGRIRKRLVYRFSCMSDLLRACRALAGRGYSEPSDSYITQDRESIYLIVSDGDVDVSVLLEYSEPVFFGGMAMYISEHCIPVCETEAVGVLGALC